MLNNNTNCLVSIFTVIFFLFFAACGDDDPFDQLGCTNHGDYDTAVADQDGIDDASDAEGFPDSEDNNFTVCSGDWMLCNDVCVNTVTDENHCGGCGQRCTGETSCQSSYYERETLPGSNCGCSNFERLCNGSCRITSWDNENCGGCDISCDEGQVCNHGRCDDVCDDSGVCAGQCTNLTWDPDNCGWCGRVCSDNNIVTRNCFGDCGGSCVTGFLDCNENKGYDGCETDSLQDNNNCGACGFQCLSYQTCNNGVCE